MPWHVRSELFSIRFPENDDSMNKPQPLLQLTQLFNMSPRVDELTPTATKPFVSITLFWTRAYVDRSGRVRGPARLSSREIPHAPFRSTLFRIVALEFVYTLIKACDSA